MLSQAEITNGHEVAAFPVMLDTLPDLREVVVTADVLNCQRSHADYLG